MTKSENDFDITETARRITIPVAVILEKKTNTDKKWSYPSWRIFAVISGAHLNPDDQQMTVHDAGTIHRYYWGGMSLDFYKDGTEGYWYNLLSDTPNLFVICDGELTDDSIEPRYITANQDEATGHMESDDIVLSVPMPAAITELLERYVISHYQPKKKKKRKRTDWIEDSLYAKKT